MCVCVFNKYAVKSESQIGTSAHDDSASCDIPAIISSSVAPFGNL